MDEWEDLLFELKHHCKYEFLSIRKRCVKRKQHGNKRIYRTEN